jgi:heat shock protein HspQ
VKERQAREKKRTNDEAVENFARTGIGSGVRHTLYTFRTCVIEEA